MRVSKKTFGQTERRISTKLFSLSNDHGMKVDLTNWGATVVSIVVPDRHGQPQDVVLGYDSPAAYARDPFYFGSSIGRCANRIAFAKFRLGNQVYTLTQNEGRHHLHGGLKGFNRVLWKASPIHKENACGIRFEYLSEDGEEGYPGNLNVAVTYLLPSDNELQITYEATTDQDTVVNLTNHSYFNLRGAGCGDILSHHIKINADRFAPIDAQLIPKGPLRSVAGTPFDFRHSRVISGGLQQGDSQITRAGGYDHNWVLNPDDEKLTAAAEVYEPVSGRMLQVLTSQPGIQFYTGNSIDSVPAGKNGVPYHRHSGFCLESQHYPDAPNRPDFPSILLRNGDIYRQKTIFRFSVR